MGNERWTYSRLFEQPNFAVVLRPQTLKQPRTINRTTRLSKELYRSCTFWSQRGDERESLKRYSESSEHKWIYEDTGLFRVKCSSTIRSFVRLQSCCLYIVHVQSYSNTIFRSWQDPFSTRRPMTRRYLTFDTSDTSCFVGYGTLYFILAILIPYTYTIFLSKPGTCGIPSYGHALRSLNWEGFPHVPWTSTVQCTSVPYGYDHTMRNTSLYTGLLYYCTCTA